MRKLAQVAEILDVVPIAGADAIELVSVLGWKCIAKKGEFKPKDKCVYFEIDSVLPAANPAFNLMEKHKYRVKTIKFNRFGVISQGLALPLSIISDIPYELLELGGDLTDVLGVKKWEPEETETNRTFSDARREFPECVPKTDETRIQAEPGLIDEFVGQTCVVTLKCDGSSASFIHNRGEYDVCSRNRSVKDAPDNVWWMMSRKHNLEEKLRAKGNYGIQGELCGPGIQKNRLKLTEHKLFIFNAYHIDSGRHFEHKDLMDLCKEFDLETVPIIDDNFVFNHSIDQLLALARGTYPGTENPREGLVIRTVNNQYSQILRSRKSVKVINNEYLVKYGD